MKKVSFFSDIFNCFYRNLYDAHHLDVVYSCNDFYLSFFCDFRKWFNANFAISLDGKFKGLWTVFKVINPISFINKLCQLAAKGKFSGDKESFKIFGHKVTLYAR